VKSVVKIIQTSILLSSNASVLDEFGVYHLVHRKYGASSDRA